MYKVQDKISSWEQHSEMESSSNTDNELVPFEQLPYWIKFCYKYSSLRPSKKMKCITALLDLARIPGFCCLCVGLAGGNLAVGLGMSIISLIFVVVNFLVDTKVDTEHYYMKMLRRDKILAEKINKKM